MANLRRIYSDLQSLVLNKSTHPQTIRILSISINTWVVINTLILLPSHRHFWSSSAYINYPDPDSLSWLDRLTGLLLFPNYTDYYPLIIMLQLIAAAFALLKVYPVFAQILVTWTTMTLDSRASVIMDGGNNLIHLFLLYLILMVASPQISNFKHLTETRIALSNLAFLLARLQLALVYLTAGLSKIQGNLWPKGVALYYTLNVSEYSTPLLGKLMSLPLLTVLASYSTLVFQISFIFLIWNRSFRPYFLLAGALFHMGISFGMGLMSFGFAMCACYFVFYTNEHSDRTLCRIKSWLFPSRLHIAFDDNCYWCQKFSRAISFLDWRKLVFADSARYPRTLLLQTIPREHRLQTIHACDDQGIISGFAVLTAIFKRVPCLMLFAPLMHLVYKTGLGDALYTRFCLKANWRHSCTNHTCMLKETLK